jgi:hypothetical protein
MPVILLWAIPTIIVIGGASYYLIHVHRAMLRRPQPKAAAALRLVGHSISCTTVRVPGSTSITRSPE